MASAASSSQQISRRPRILVAATGCIAAANLGPICERLKQWADVQAVVTESAKNFLDRTTIPDSLTIYSDISELTFWNKLGDPLLHAQLPTWADMMLIAPLSANTLAKIAAGLSDNLVTLIVKAWDCKKPLFIAPAMSPEMWNNTLTEQHLTFMEDEMNARHIRHDTSDSDSAPMATVDQICSTIYTVWKTQNRQPAPPGNH